MSYPATLDTFIDPLANNKLNNPSHSAIERAQNAALTALESTVGTTGSAVTTSLQYKVVNPLSIDPGHLHTISGFSGNFPSSRISGTFPSTSITGTWPATALAGTVPTGNLPVGTNAGQLLIFPLNGILPAVNASALTNLPNLSNFLLVSDVTINQACVNATLTNICQFTGLTGDTDDIYEIDYEFVGTQDSSNPADFLYLKFNNTGANPYSYTMMRQSDGVAGNNNLVASSNSAVGIALAAGANSGSNVNGLSVVSGKIRIKASKTIAGTIRHAIGDAFASATNGTFTGQYRSAGAWNETGTQITSLQLYYIQNSGSSSTVTGKATLFKINR